MDFIAVLYSINTRRICIYMVRIHIKIIRQKKKKMTEKQTYLQKNLLHGKIFLFSTTRAYISFVLGSRPRFSPPIKDDAAIVAHVCYIS